MHTLAGANHLAALGAALTYPCGGFRESLHDLRGSLETRSAGASQALGEFLDATLGFNDNAHAETYTRTFDLAPQCAPYLGVHLFGDQDARRSQLMIGLANEYAKAGFQTQGELPDHIAVVLQSLRLLPADEVREIVELCVMPALASMIKQLASTGNPYGHLMTAVSLLANRVASEAQPVEARHA